MGGTDLKLLNEISSFILYSPRTQGGFFHTSAPASLAQQVLKFKPLKSLKRCTEAKMFVTVFMILSPT